MNDGRTHEYLNCPKCSKKLRLPATSTFKRVTCPNCRHSFGFQPGIGEVYDAKLKLPFSWRHVAEKPKFLWVLLGAAFLFMFFAALYRLDGDRGTAALNNENRNTASPAGLSNKTRLTAPSANLPDTKSIGTDTTKPVVVRIPEPKLEAEPVIGKRPVTGHRIGRWAGANGVCRLTVENGLDVDAAVALTPEGAKKAYRYFYVRAGDTFTLKKIRAGTYSLFFQTGLEWAETSQRFTSSLSMQKFTELLPFRVVRYESGAKYSVKTVTLHPVPGGTAHTESADDSEFPEED